MNIIEKLNSDLKTAMIAKDSATLTTIRAIKTAIKNKQVELKTTEELSNSEIVNVLVKQYKTRKESIEQYQKANRNDLVEIETNELNYIEEFLPKTIGDDELTEIVKTEITNLGSNTGAVIKSVKSIVESKGLIVDGKNLANIVKGLI